MDDPAAVLLKRPPEVASDAPFMWGQARMPQLDVRGSIGKANTLAKPAPNAEQGPAGEHEDEDDQTLVEEHHQVATAAMEEQQRPPSSEPRQEAPTGLQQPSKQVINQADGIPRATLRGIHKHKSSRRPKATDRFSRATEMTYKDIGGLFKSLHQRDLQTKQEHDVYQQAVVEANIQLQRLEKENTELAKLVADSESRTQPQEKYKAQVLRVRKYLEGVSGDLEALKRGRSSLDKGFKELKNGISQMKTTGRDAQSQVKTTIARLGQAKLERKAVIEVGSSFSTG